jgi:hypothetical protein
MTEKGTDGRLDEFEKRVDERFDRVDDRFEQVKTLIFGGLAMTSVYMAGFAALVTQL